MIPTVIAILSVTVFSALFSPMVSAESALDDVTMRVIGLDEIPATSLRIIEIPQPDLGELADIHESFVSPTQDLTSPPAGTDSVVNVPPDDGGTSRGQ